jgi:pantoate--beta-alanine ligase
MRTIHTIAELRSALGLLRRQGKTIGFVPTMGALHQGHRSLVRLSKIQCDVTVVSIFVNPTQFGAGEDFAQYPRTLSSDEQQLVEEDVEFLFVPSAADIYPNGAATSVHVHGLSELYEGAIRPGHFDGVSTVVAILFNIVQPDVAYFGQKDAQQVAVLKRMVADLHLPVKMIVGPTIRESNGLALSSRNTMLGGQATSESVSLSAALRITAMSLRSGQGIADARDRGISEFKRLAPHGELDYLSIVDSETFRQQASFEPTTGLIIIAARFDTTRLIDNLPLDE